MFFFLIKRLIFTLKNISFSFTATRAQLIYETTEAWKGNISLSAQGDMPNRSTRLHTHRTGPRQAGARQLRGGETLQWGPGQAGAPFGDRSLYCTDSFILFTFRPIYFI